MGLWTKIFNMLKTVGGAVKDAFSYGSQGAEIGAGLGPEGAAVGAVGGAIVGLVMNGSKIYDAAKAFDEPDVQSVSERLTGGQAQAAMSYAYANPNDPGSVVMKNMLAGVQQGASWRSAYNSAGGQAYGFSRVMSDAAIMGTLNRASGDLGIHPQTAMALGNGALSSAMMKTGGQSQSHFYGVNDHILGAAYGVSSQALANTNSRFISRTAVTPGSGGATVVSSLTA